MPLNDLKLSRLAYEVVIDSIVLPYNSEFYGSGGYSAFLHRQDYFSTNSDLSMQYRKAFPSINLALARLQQYDKLPFFYEKLNVYIDSETGEKYADLSDVKYRSIVNVFRKTGDGRWTNYAFTIEEERLVIQGEIPFDKKDDEGKRCGRVEIEYKKRIPIFSPDDIVVDSIDSGSDGISYNDNNIDLRDYGLDELSYQFVKAYAESEIVTELDPTTGFNRKQIAENYFLDLKTNKPTYTQRNIVRKF